MACARRLLLSVGAGQRCCIIKARRCPCQNASGGGLRSDGRNGISRWSAVATQKGHRSRPIGSPGVGVWLSLVERTVRVREVGSSNLPTPTSPPTGGPRTISGPSQRTVAKGQLVSRVIEPAARQGNLFSARVV